MKREELCKITRLDFQRQLKYHLINRSSFINYKSNQVKEIKKK